MISRLLLAATLVGCKGGADPAAGGGGNYAGMAELEAEFVDPEAPEAAPWLLRIDEERWEIRDGDRWADAAVVGAWSVDRSDGLQLDDVRMLPKNAEEGASADGLRVDFRGEVEVYYGVFPDAVETTVSGGGPLEGSHAFAKGIGPIRLTVGGETREVAFYW